LLQRNHKALYGSHDALMEHSELYSKIYGLQYPEGGVGDEA